MLTVLNGFDFVLFSELFGVFLSPGLTLLLALVLLIALGAAILFIFSVSGKLPAALRAYLFYFHLFFSVPPFLHIVLIGCQDRSDLIVGEKLIEPCSGVIVKSAP